ncbi:hypothetical protein C7999DRAFT_30872 [Corynascus novoguineensis]|uniref:Ankyrin repeat protein n=1 Tax=Corynascus novoguineensis TaxID=1126955 RepID=A0AAN7CUJ4_9PEZI|nr:hypothetical protein C7999DRAFT_30872 [Corynascus novoguineensis]
MDGAAQPAQMSFLSQPPSSAGQEGDTPRPAERSDQVLNTINADLDTENTPHINPAMESSTSPLAEPEESAKTEEPAKPDEPEKPETRDEAQEPQKQEKQEEPKKPGTSEMLETPETPDEPEKPEKPKKPEELEEQEKQEEQEEHKKPGPGVPPTQEAETRNQTAALVSINPQPTLPAPGVSIQSLAERWRRQLQDKVGFPRPKPQAGNATAALQKPDATEAGSSKSADGQEEATTIEADKAEAAKPEVKLPELPALVDLSNLPLPVLPSMDVIAVHDLGHSLTAAWAYSPEKAFTKRPSASSRQPYTPANPISGLANSSHPLPLGQQTALKADHLKVLGEAKVRDIHGWRVEVEPHDQPAKGRKPESHEQPSLPAVPAADVMWIQAPEGEPDVSSVDKGKGRDDGDQSTPTLGIGASEEGKSRPPPAAQQQIQPPMADKMDEEKPHDDGGTTRVSRQSDRPSSNTGSKPQSEKDKGSKVGSWLTDPTMLAGDLDRARVLAFSYRSLEPTQSPQPTDNPPKKLDYDKYLKEMAEALLSQLKEKRAGHLSQTLLVFIGAGFGCLIIQKLIVLIAESEELPMLNIIAALHFFDAPSTILPEAGTSNINLPPPANSSRAAQVKAILESKAVDSWGLWSKFQVSIKQRELSTVWYYTPAKVPSRMVIRPYAAGVRFVVLDPLPTKPPAPAPAAPLPPPTTTSRQPSRFRGPRDPNYRTFVDQIKRCLVLKASANKGLEELLVQFITSGYELGVTDHKRRCPLHLAAECVNDVAISRLVSARPDLVVKRDEDGLTPLHVVVHKAVAINPKEEDRAPFRAMIEKLLYALAENEHEDHLEDSSGKSPWEYAEEDNHQWIRDLREPGFLVNGARRAGPETIKDLVVPPTQIEVAACRKSVATIAQFYIAKDGSEDYLDLQRPDVYTVIYDQQYGVDNWFHRNHRHDKVDMRPTCRWIHLPANNEQWIHDLFVQQLRRIDKSTSGRRHRGSAPFDRHIVPDSFRYKQTYEPLAEEPAFPSPTSPFPSPSFSVKSSEVPGTIRKPVTALFMPIFGFEKHENRKKLTLAMREPFCPGTDETSRLIRAYFDNDRFPLHCRRTLDQFTYHMLEDTERRDNTQVMFKWTKRDQANKERASHHQHNLQPSSTPRRHDKGSYPLLMIDQLWIWILEDDQTVIMSVPNTWESGEDYNLVRYLIREKLKDNNDRPLIEGPVDLANFIIRCSVDFLHRPGPLGVRLYDCFQSSITLIAEKQAIQFDKFKLLVKNLSKDGLDQRTRNKLTNSLFRLRTETRLLAEIMDIQDELNTIQGVLVKQRDVLYKFVHLLSNDPDKNKTDDASDIVDTPESSQYGSATLEDVYSFESPDGHTGKRPPPSALHRDGARPRVKRNVQFVDERVPHPRSKSWKQAKANLDLVQSNIATIEEMTQYARKVQVEINGLLSHRQKQANAWEARFAREGSEHTQRQSNITLVFTIVTVFFLPLSFMSSVFAIQIDAFPHNPETGEVNWPVGEAMGLIFGIAFGMILLIAFVGFYVNRISRFFTENFGPASLPPVGPPDAAHPHDSDSDSDQSDIMTRSHRHLPRPESTESSRRPRNKHKHASEASPVDTMDLAWARNREYAPLFGRWHFHSKIPLIRRLWEFGFYYSTSKKKSGGGGSRPSSATSSSHDTRDHGGGRRVARSTTTSTWGQETDDFYSEAIERDYALHRARVLVGEFVADRILRPMGRLVPAGWRGESREEKGDDEEVDYDPSEDGGGNGRVVVGYTIRPSMQRTSTEVTMESWGMPAGPIRRRRVQERRRRGPTSFVAGFMSGQWRETLGGFGARRHNAPTVTTASWESSGGSFPTSVGVVFASDEDDSAANGRGDANGEEWRARGNKGVGFALPLPFFGRKKVKVDDLESSRRSED